MSSSKNLTSESSPNSRETTMAAQTLDPNCILDIERSARHLATSVDEMVENLSGVLHGKYICCMETMILFYITMLLGMSLQIYLLQIFPFRYLSPNC